MVVVPYVRIVMPNFKLLRKESRRLSSKYVLITSIFSSAIFYYFISPNKMVHNNAQSESEICIKWAEVNGTLFVIGFPMPISSRIKIIGAAYTWANWNFEYEFRFAPINHDRDLLTTLRWYRGQQKYNCIYEVIKQQTFNDIYFLVALINTKITYFIYRFEMEIIYCSHY